jgi:Type IV secretion system pilin
MKKIALASLTSLTFAAPFVAFAQSVTTVQSGAQYIINLINNVAVPLIFAFAFLVFIYGIFTYFIRGGHDEPTRKKGLGLILYGLIGFFVMISVWGLVRLLVGTANLDNNNNIPFPAARQTGL